MFGLFDGKRGGNGLTGVVLDSDNACLVHITRDKTQPRLTACATDAVTGEDAGRVIRRLADRDKQARGHCTTLLHPADYQLLLVEAPDVRPDELRAAVRWRIKDLINFHIDDAIIDVFDIPGQTHRGKGKMMYAVAARVPVVQQRIGVFEDTGLDLDIIDIPEMALRNLAALLPQDTRGVALLHLERDYGLITLTRQNTLYLSRKLDTGWQSLHRPTTRAGLLEGIVLEIQRSLDYYESHYDTSPIGDLVITPQPEPIEELEQHLRDNLSVNVQALNLQDLLDIALPLDAADQAQYLTAIGAALRREEVAL